MRTRFLLVGVLTLTVCGSLAAIVTAKHGDRSRSVKVTLKNVNGVSIGKARLTQRGSKGPVDVRVSVRRLQPGFHGFHVHGTGICEVPTFASAGGHFKQAGTNHGAHAGDMPSLLVKRNGTASLRFTTDSFGLDDLRDADGSAIMVHAGADNFANVPSRYAPDGPDEATLNTGDAGGRVACGAIGAKRSG